MSVYIIARFKIHDRNEYDRYSAGFPAVFQQFDGTMLSIDAVSYTHLTLPTTPYV